MIRYINGLGVCHKTFVKASCSFLVSNADILVRFHFQVFALTCSVPVFSIYDEGTIYKQPKKQKQINFNKTGKSNSLGRLFLF